LPHGALVNAIEGITGSPYSHCGVVTKIDEEWYVIEAIGPVKETPLGEFIAQGRQFEIDVFRLKEEYREGIDGFISHLRSYRGKPYDLRYRMDDSKIYCSELIYKAFEKQYGEELGDIKKLGDMNWKPYESTIVHYERGPVPLDREMITPIAVAEATQVEMVYDGSEDGLRE